jgi:hypothetical protein
MAYFASENMLKGGANYLGATCNLIGVVFEYTVSDSYATVFGNLLASASRAAGNFSIAADGLSQVLTAATAQEDAATAAEVSSHIVYLDTVGSEVILVIPETSLVAINVGDIVNFPEVAITYHQPTA